MKRFIFSHIALLLANTIYGVNYIFAKDVMPNYIDPTAFILLRIMGAGLIFYLLSFFLIGQKIERKDWYYLFICALFGVVLNMLCFFEGLNLTSPINASLIMITTPLIVYIISCYFSPKERQISRLIGVLLGLLGAALLITDGRMLNLKIINIGDLLVFINAVSYAIYLILIKSMMQKYHPIIVLRTLFLIGFIIIFPIGWSDFLEVDFQAMPKDIIFKTLFVVLCTTCFAYFLNIYAISNLTSSAVAFYIYLQPAIATLIAVFFDKDIITNVSVLSAILIFIGVYFVIKTKPI